MSVHFAMDVPRYSEVTAERHSDYALVGRVIEHVEFAPAGMVDLILDDGRRVRCPSTLLLSVRSTPEQMRRLDAIRGMLGRGGP